MTTNESTPAPTIELSTAAPRSYVRYERLFNLGNYENLKIGLSEPVGDDETPEQALERAKAFVEAQYGERQERERAAMQLNELESLAAGIKRRIRRLNGLHHDRAEQYRLLREKLVSLGASVPDLDYVAHPYSEEQLDRLLGDAEPEHDEDENELDDQYDTEPDPDDL